MLYLVPTPIGNLEDITYRAVKILKEVDFILAEDTRTSKVLLNHYDIDTPLRSHHIHNEHGTIPNILDQLKGGQTIALISDAGTPAISDPGFLLVREALKNDITVRCLPGATAFVPAMVHSGIPCSHFHYEGFLPHKKGRKTRLEYLASLDCPFILYESPHRLVKALKQLAEHCGEDRNASVSRELTKLHEEVQSDSLKNLIAHFDTEKKVKGELVVVVAGA